MWPGFSRQERLQELGYQTTVFVAGMVHNFQVFSQLIGYSPTVFARSKSYTPNHSGKHFKLVETFLIVVVSQHVFSAEIENPFFYKVFQLAPGVVILQRILPWWVVEFPIIIIAWLQIPPLCRGVGVGGTND